MTSAGFVKISTASMPVLYFGSGSAIKKRSIRNFPKGLVATKELPPVPAALFFF